MSKLAAMLPAAAAGGTAAASSAIPLALASTALSGLGSLIQAREKQGAIDRRNEALLEVDTAERARQDQLRAQSQAALDQMVAQHTADARTNQVAQETARLQEAIAAPAADIPILPTVPGRERAGTIIQEDAARQMAEATQEARKRLSALAGVTAFNTVGSQLAADRARSAADEAIRGGLRQGGLASASQQRQFHNAALEAFEPSPLGGLLSGIGQLGSFAAGAGMNPFGGGGAGTIYSGTGPGPA